MQQPQPKDFETIKQFVHAMLLHVDHVDDDGRPWGVPFHEIQKLVLDNYKVVRTAGKRRGKPSAMSVKSIREEQYSLRLIRPELRVPYRKRGPRIEKPSTNDGGNHDSKRP